VLSVLAGNIGTALLDTPPGQDVTVIEMSSYQIADLTHAPDMAVVTNVYPAHGDWHGVGRAVFCR
jgi:UDP-N-acetylmuramoylalanine-D-glutamate ligase